MSNFNEHPHIPFDPSFLSTPTRRRHRPASPHDEELGLETQFSFSPSQQSRPLTLLDIDVRNKVRSYPQPIMNEQLGAAAPVPIAEMT